MSVSELPALRSVRLQIMLDRDELQAIDDWRYSHRMPSLAAAIRDLIRRGLSSGNVACENVGRDEIGDGVVTRQRSSDFRAV